MLNSRRVLLVEDEWLVRSTVADGLRDDGYEVVEAESADEASQLLDRCHFDILLTDVRTPGRLDGLDLAAYARRSNRDVPILVMSGYANQLNGRLAAVKGRTAFLPKPFAMGHLLGSLTRLIGTGHTATHNPDAETGTRDASGNSVRQVAAKLDLERERQRRHK